MSNTSDQTTQQSKTRLIVGEVGVDTETGIVGKGHSYDNGKTFTVDDTIYGRIYHADDHGKIWKGIQDQVAKVVAPAKSAADSAQSTADAAVASAQVTSDAVTAIASATAEAKQGANEAMSRANSAWDVATGAKEAVTDFDPLLKSAQSDASNALTQIADTANALSDAKTEFGSDVAEAKNLASTAQATADSAVAVASDASSNATVAIQTASQASLTAINAQGDATIAKQTASEATVQVSNAESDFAQLSIRANKIEANVADNSGAIASVQQTANGLTTTVAELNARDGINLLQGTSTTDNEGPSDFSGIPVTAGDSYTFSGIMSSTSTSGVIAPYIWFYDNSGNLLKQFGKNINVPIASGTSFVITGVEPANAVTAHVFLAKSDDSITFNYCSLKFEHGSQATPWTPAPTDASVAYNSLKVMVGQTSDIINDPKTGLNATYQTTAGNTTTISNVKGDVTQLQATANGLTSRVGDLESKTNSQQTTIDQNKAAIALKADQTTVNTLKGTVDQNTATLQTQAGQIQSKVSASDVSGMLTGYATQSYAQSLVTQTANNWNLNLTKLQTDVNAIKTTGGGVNLVGNSEAEFSGKAYDFHYYHLASSNALTPSKTYIMSFSTKVDDKAVNGQQNVFVYINTPSWSWGTMASAPISTDYQRITYTFTVPEGITDASVITAYLSHPTINGKSDPSSDQSDAAGTGYIKDFMIEEGIVAHPWSPAPSDLATVVGMANLSATVDGIKSTVATKADQSTVTQLSNALQSKVESSTYTSAINQLSNDINLRVKSADLISQINLQAGTALIQSNKLVLDAGTTVITGDAFIPSAAISSIQADQIQIGNSRLFSDDGTFNLINQNVGTASIKLTTGNVQGSAQPVTEFSNGYNLTAMDISPVGTVIRPTLFFEDYPGQAKDTGFLGFSRRGTAELQFHTYDDTKELFRISCAARVNHDLHVDGSLWQGGLSIGAGNTIWSGSDYLAIGDHISNSYTNVIAKSFSQQSTLSSKTNIETVDPKDALDLVNRTDIRSYQYKTDVAEGKTKRYTSMIIDDVNDVSQYYAPNEFTNEERTGRDDGSAVGYLFLAVQELTRRIKTLEEKLNG